MHMGQNLVRGVMLLFICGSLLAGSGAAKAASSDFHLVGLAQHQQTGRNIYLGAIYFDQHVPKPADMVAASGPKLMEYRVIARRTSIRSLLGGMLLQSEVATGAAPDAATTEFANAILSTVKGSLYAGDSFEILLSEEDETLAYLNGHEIARADEGSVSDYLLMGWVGERGPSTVFRASMLADEIDPSLLSDLETGSFSIQRAAEIAGWIGTPQPGEQPDTVAATTTSAEPAGSSLPGPEPEPEQLAEIAVLSQRVSGEAVYAAAQMENTATPEPALQLPVASQPPIDQLPDPMLTGQDQESIQVAALAPTADLLQPADDNSIQALGITEYSERLTEFHGQLVAMVYREIRYPKRAVRRGLQGRLELDVTLLEDGKLVAINVAQPSGHSILDNAAIKAANNALAAGQLQDIDPVAVAEFSSGQGGNIVVPVPVNFMLQD